MQPTQPLPQPAEISDESYAWACLQALARRASRGRAVTHEVGLRLDAHGALQETSAERGLICVRPDLAAGWSSQRALDPKAARLFDLFMPLCTGPSSSDIVIAHLGQSADGHVATFAGTNKFITGDEDIRHTHRLRALFDVVLVGASTVAIDDPLLTTRLVPGKTPVRVVIDPNGRLQRHHRVFGDERHRTIVVSDGARASQLPPHVEHMGMRRAGDGFDVPELLSQLRRRGLRRIFIEGGEITINRFLKARALHRLQIAVAPVEPGPGPRAVPRHLTPAALPRLGRVRSFDLGADRLFEAELTARAV
jgi:riboflavin-specific deaminase-like protein